MDQSNTGQCVSRLIGFVQHNFYLYWFGLLCDAAVKLHEHGPADSSVFHVAHSLDSFATFQCSLSPVDLGFTDKR